MSQDSTLPAYGALYAFGDSLSDAGNLSIATGALGAETPASPYFQETYKTPVGQVSANVFSNGPTWVQDLSLALNLGTLEPSLLGGNDFAYGGAETGVTPQNTGETDLRAISLPSQFVQFQSLEPDPTANALYTLSIGSNDILDILADATLSGAQQTTDVTDAVDNEIGFMQSMHGAGAEDWLVLNVPDLGKTPEVMDGLANGSDSPSAGLDSLASSLASEYNADLAGQLGTLNDEGYDITLANAFQLIDNAVSNPSAYGLSNVTSPVWTGGYGGYAEGSGSLTAAGAAQDQYLFFDHLHPTETGEQAVATLAENDLSGACYAAGTRIALESGGWAAVEHLREGDRVRLARGGSAPVTWLGHRRVESRRHPRPADVQPVRVAAHAFGLGRPARDLVLSPDHAVWVEGVLIPIRYLLNDATVRQEEVAAITYWHVELPTHDVLLAEGLPAESYLDTGNRSAFTNGGGATWAHPDFSRAVWALGGCAPLVTEGTTRDLVYRQLLAQAFTLGWRPVDAGGGASNWVAPAAIMAG